MALWRPSCLSTAHADARRLVIYHHAGGFVFGSLASHRALCSYLAQFSGAPVLNVDYRLAPEHPAPAAHDDALAAYEWALAQGYAASAIVLAGDSAGGQPGLVHGQCVPATWACRCLRPSWRCRPRWTWRRKAGPTTPWTTRSSRAS
ncbi:alpha/beta hydrolase fold domain-containing protein [Acidovorax sp. 106]|uniref:alpha/beta hydrolase fold domain-containing protein n=1 Tax=Acidovorax sp. 106 TaxID=2135637 RepID=UPI0018F61ADF|nr:alpha/beta hydrolase fold domain-containing protein [Acidovorax sp. 106]